MRPAHQGGLRAPLPALRRRIRPHDPRLLLRRAGLCQREGHHLRGRHLGLPHRQEVHAAALVGRARASPARALGRGVSRQPVRALGPGDRWRRRTRGVHGGGHAPLRGVLLRQPRRLVPRARRLLHRARHRGQGRPRAPRRRRRPLLPRRGRPGHGGRGHRDQPGRPRHRLRYARLRARKLGHGVLRLRARQARRVGRAPRPKEAGSLHGRGLRRLRLARGAAPDEVDLRPLPRARRQLVRAPCLQHGALPRPRLPAALLCARQEPAVQALPRAHELPQPHGYRALGRADVHAGGRPLPRRRRVGRRGAAHPARGRRARARADRLRLRTRRGLLGGRRSGPLPGAH